MGEEVAVACGRLYADGGACDHNIDKKIHRIAYELAMKKEDLLPETPEDIEIAEGLKEGTEHQKRKAKVELEGAREMARSLVGKDCGPKNLAACKKINKHVETTLGMMMGLDKNGKKVE